MLWHRLMGPWLSLHLLIWRGTLSYLVLVGERDRLLMHSPWPPLKTSCLGLHGSLFRMLFTLSAACSCDCPGMGGDSTNLPDEPTRTPLYSTHCQHSAGRLAAFQVPPRGIRYKSSLWSSLSIYLEFHHPILTYWRNLLLSMRKFKGLASLPILSF